ncbi:hypothetical protein JVT61DRAFT_11247 [Boletus reticuloceps]|uniref:Uncharacterized protein n=1 Tax=Boletus reticuloceps TaxID=495285 RepID=A0A8I2YEY1_9AGAM|nr:hypothetical protein JVT61DRAFT_11247 [Boletus reticuloceps]
MHSVSASSDAFSRVTRAQNVNAEAGPSCLPRLQPESVDAEGGSMSIGVQRLRDDLRSISNERRGYGFPDDARKLRNCCMLHGIGSEFLEDNHRCFLWLVDHLFSGGCVRVRDASKYTIQQQQRSGYCHGCGPSTIIWTYDRDRGVPEMRSTLVAKQAYHIVTSRHRPKESKKGHRRPNQDRRSSVRPTNLKIKALGVPSYTYTGSSAYDIQV